MSKLADEFGLGGTVGQQVKQKRSSLAEEFGLQPIEPKAEGVSDTLIEGAKSTGRALGSAVRTYTGNGQGIADNALEQQQAPRDERLVKFQQDFAERTDALGDDPSVLDTIGEGIGAIADNPAGAGLAVLEQLPNAAVSLGAGWAGLKAGGAAGAGIGSVVPGVGTVAGGTVGGILGGLAGMFLGNAALETGNKAMGMADDGEVTPEEMAQARSEGAIKGGVITGIDALTLGVGGKVASTLQRTSTTAIEAATRKALVDRGIDIADEAAVLAARSNPEIAGAVRVAQENARKATDKLGKRLAVGGAVLGLETVGEGVGEYLGELAATGEGNVPDAVLESLLSLGQSGAETAWNMARTSPANLVQPAPTAENPAPAPVPRPDPSAGSISRAAAMLPAPERLALPAPDQILYADSEGQVSQQGPLRDVDREQRPVPGRAERGMGGGPGMDQQTPRGVLSIAGDLLPAERARSAAATAPAAAIYEGELVRPALADMRPEALIVDSQGEARPGRVPNIQPPAADAGGDGMTEQARPVQRPAFDQILQRARQGAVTPDALVAEMGATRVQAARAVREAQVEQSTMAAVYRGVPAANKALRGLARAGEFEVVKAGPREWRIQRRQEVQDADRGRGAADERAAGDLPTAPTPADLVAGGAAVAERPATTVPAREPGRTGIPTPNEGNNRQRALSSPASRKGDRRRVNRDRDSLLQAVIRLGGIKSEWRQDTTGDTKGNRHLPGIGALWSDKTGTSIDDMASQLDQYGYLPAGEMDNLGGVPWLQQAIRDELAGVRYYAAESAAQQEQMERELQQRYADEAERERQQFEAYLAQVESEYGAALANRLREHQQAAEALDNQLLAEAQRYEDEYDEREDSRAESLEYGPGGAGQAALEGEPVRQADDGQDSQQRAPAGSGQGQAGESVGFSLEQQTEESLREQAAQQQAAEKAEAEAQRQAEQKAQADRDRADFTLSGSDRPADIAEARGQNDMFAPRTRGDAKKIEDFGEKLLGARKFQTFSQRMDEAKALEVKAVPLSKSWPEPDYQALLADGADPWAVGFLRAAREEIPNKPSKGWKVDRWAEQVTKLRDMATKVAADPDYAVRVKARAGDAAGLDKGFLGRVELYERFGHDVPLKGMKLHSSYFSLYRGEKDVTKWIVDGPNERNRLSNWPVEYAVADTKEAVLEAFAKVHAKLKAKGEEADVGPKIRFDIFSDRYTKSVFIGKKNGKRVVKMKNFPDVQAARDYLKNNQAELEAQYERMKQLPAVRGEDNAPRVGADYRNGLDVTPELFSETFGFRGVQFGNYVEGRRRQQDLNDAFDALMDMAGILNIPPRAISLNGELGLAFGARGTGGPDPAMAHYERDQVVINLTKAKGAGSLGHEWWHSLDNYLSRARGAPDGMLSEAAYERGTGVRPEIVEAFANINKAINRTQLRQRSEKMDELRTKDYWSTKLEMTARAFESYLIAKLSEGGVRSDYLANVVSEQAFELEDSYPYPTAAEIPEIRAAYDELFQVIETRQDDKGNVALYRLKPDEPMLRLNPGSAAGIPPVSAKAIAQQVQEATGLRAKVVDTEFALPMPVLEQVLRDGAVGRVAGVYHNGQAYLVASNLQSSKHAQEVLLHEVVGHQGVRAVLGNRTAKVMEQIYADMPAADRSELEGRYAGQLENLSEQEQRITVAEEYVAHLAETNPKHSLIQRLVAMVRAALRRVFGATGALRWTDADIVALLADSRRMVASGAQPAAPTPKPAAAVNYRQKPVAPRPAALPQVEEVDAAEALDALAGQEGAQAFARSLYRARGTDSPFFQRWFRGSRMADRSGRPIAFYHRSFGEKDRFDDARLGGKTGTGTAALGHFLARQDVGNVERYGPVVERFFVRMRKPKVVSRQQFEAMGDWTDAQIKAYRKTMMEQGHDGLYILGLDWPVVFEGKNIKAVRNSGTFDESDQVRYSLTQDAGAIFNRFGRRPADLNDPFAEENRRLREQDKTLWSRAKQQFRRQFAPGGLLPEAVFAEKIRRDSEFQAVEFDVRHLAGGLEQAVQADFGTPIDQLPEAQMKPLAEALAGRVDPALPQRTREAVVAMRQYIDTLSGEYIGILQQQVEQNLKDADPALVETITRNLGSYVHRSYRAFDDAKWFEKVPTETLNAARRYLATQYRSQGADAQEALRQADVKVNELLKTGTAYSSMESMIAEGKLGAKDLSVLIKRKEIAPEIRALLGEYIDPRVNFAKSATKMGRLIWNQRFLDRVRAQGMGAFLFEEGDRPAGATEQLAGEQSDTYAPLNGLWTFPEVAQAFRDAMGKEQMSDLYRAIVRINGMVKYGKTVLSPTTAMRNWQSALFFSLANGHFDLTQMKKSLAAFREQVAQNATGEDLAYLRKLKQLGVVYDTPYAGEMARLLEDARLDELLDGKSGTGLKWLRKINQAAQGFYSFGDDFWKIIGFENEKAGLQQAGFSEGEAERMAAERIRNTYPTYSMVGRGIDWLRRFPLMGTFVSFPAEIVRTTVNMLRLTSSDLKSDNPALQALGRRRAVGMAMVSAGFYALSAMTAAAFGVDDEEEEALRDLAPEWQKNSTFLYAGRDADGKLRYFDMSFLDPYGYWKRPLTAMMRDQPWEKAAASGMGDMLAPFLGADIAAGALFEVMANKKGSGGPVYQENGDPVDQTLDIANHLRKALQPGFVSNAERLVLAGQGVRREGSGQAYDLRDEVVSLLGWRASTTDARTALHYRAYEFGDALAESRQVLTRELRSQNKVGEEDIRDARETAERQYQQAFREMNRLVQAAQTAGMSRPQVIQTLRMSGVSSADVAQLMRGEAPRFRLGPTAMGRAVQQARLVGGQAHAEEVARRYRLAMSL